MKLSAAQQRLVCALAQGNTLKVHRTLNGGKLFQLHGLGAAPPTTIYRSTVEALRARRLIESNMKFPAATYLLTAAGQQVATQLLGEKNAVLGATGWQS